MVDYLKEEYPRSDRDEFKEVLWWDQSMRSKFDGFLSHIQLRNELLNKHDLLIVSGGNARRIYPPEGMDIVLIRIKNPYDTWINFPHEDRYKAVYKFEFEDRDMPDTIDIDTVTELAQCLKTLPSHDLLVVHCFAGISRSSATALAYKTLMKDQDAVDKILKCQLYHPNRFVYKHLLEEFSS